jgi:hypothetical protein
VAKEAYFRLEHRSFNREDWGYGRVAEHAHYAANQNKRGFTIGFNIPDFHTSEQAREYIKSVEMLNTRKNGHLGDTLVVCLPHQLSTEHRQQLVGRFLWKISMRGRTYARAWEHVDKQHNPHVHIVLIDRDITTNKSLAKLSANRTNRAKLGFEPNATEWLRMQWEEAGNEVFHENGYDLYFDRRSNLEKGLATPGHHRGYTNDNPKEFYAEQDEIDIAYRAELDAINPPLSTVTPVDVPHETEQLAEPETPTEDAPDIEGDDEMAGSAKFNGTSDPRQIIQLLENLDYATRKMDERETVRDAIRKAEYELKRAQSFLAEAETKLTYATQAEYNAELKKDALTKDGKPIGFGVKVFGLNLRTSTRKQSDLAIERHTEAKDATERQALLVREHQEAVQRVEAHQKALDDRLFVLDRQLRQIGTDKELDTAVEAMRQGVRETFANLPREKLDEAHEKGAISDDEYEHLLREGNYDKSQDRED